jgi:hypothetical protein
MGASVLVVGTDPDVMERFGSWLEDEGLEAVGCPGPPLVGGGCIGVTSGRCPLADDAAVVVLDLRSEVLEPPNVRARAAILGMYLDLGTPTVILGDPAELGVPNIPRQVTIIGRMPDRGQFLDVVREAASTP